MLPELSDLKNDHQMTCEECELHPILPLEGVQHDSHLSWDGQA